MIEVTSVEGSSPEASSWRVHPTNRIQEPSKLDWERERSYSTLVWSLLSHCPYYTMLLITFKSLLTAWTKPWCPRLDLICSFTVFTFFFTLCSGFLQAPATIDSYNGRKGDAEYEVAKSLSHQDHTSNAWPRGRQWIARHFFSDRTPAS